MVQISSNTISQMTDLVKRSFINGIETLDSAMRSSGIVVEKAMPQHTGDTIRFAERIHRTPYASTRDEWDISSAALVQYWYEKDVQVQTVSLEISITKRMRVAGKDQEILDKVTSLVEVCPSTIDLDLTHRLTFAWSTSYVNRDGNTVSITTGDGLALISASHTLTGSATTYSTQIVGNPQFSKWALEVAEKSFVEWSYDNLGNKMVCKADTIITTDDPNSINQVRELMNATANVDTSNSNTFNVYKSAYKHVILPRLATTATGAVDTTKRKYRFLASGKSSDFYLAVLESPYLKTPMDWNNWEEFSSENWNYLTWATYGMWVVTARRIRGSKWDGS
jgi:hypothetical protein